MDSTHTVASRIRLLLRAGWYLCIAAGFAITWVAPDTFGPTTVHKLTFLMLIEFLVVHATGFFTAAGSMRREAIAMPSVQAASSGSGALQRLAMVTGLLLLYVLFAWGFSVSYGNAWPLFAFLLVVLPRLPDVVLRPTDDDETGRAMAAWAAMTALYLGGAFATLALPVPPLGITPAVVAAQGFDGGGAWPEEPWRAVAFGCIYFTGLAVVTALFERAARRRAMRSQADSRRDRGGTGFSSPS